MMKTYHTRQALLPFPASSIRDENDEGDFSDKREIRTGYSIPIGMFEKLVQVIVYQLVFLKK